MIRLALLTGQPVSEVLEWDDRTIATAWDWLDDQGEAQRDAARAAARTGGRR
jgi:hypothetical protein